MSCPLNKTVCYTQAWSVARAARRPTVSWWTCTVAATRPTTSASATKTEVQLTIVDVACWRGPPPKSPSSPSASSSYVSLSSSSRSSLSGCSRRLSVSSPGRVHRPTHGSYLPSSPAEVDCPPNDARHRPELSASERVILIQVKDV